MVLGPTLSSNDSLEVLTFCSLIIVAPMFAYLKLHRFVFRVSWILLRASCYTLPNPLLTNRLIQTWKKMLWNQILQILQIRAFFEEIHVIYKHCLIIVFHILLGNIYNMFEQCKTFFVYFCICPSQCCPFICFVNCPFPIISPCFDF